MNNPLRPMWATTPGLRRKRASAPSHCEMLEARRMLSVAAAAMPHHVALAQPTFRLAFPKLATRSSFPTGTTPQQMRHFYALDALNFNGITANGSGQTIALVEAWDDPGALSDLQTFDTRFGLPDPPSFQKLSQSGGTVLPSTPPSNNQWNIETSLDIQWAHVIAPAANIVVIECSSNSDISLYRGAVTAAGLPGVVAVSMSFGGGESPFDTGTNSTFVTPNGHPGVTFFASTGDGGSPGGYPAYSPNVVAVGGTSIHLGSGGAYGSEQGWGGSGGGFSQFESEPNYQRSVQTTGQRSIPDVSMDADPNTGVPVFDSYDFPSSSGASWVQLGGTSLSAPLWAGIIALVDQVRSANGLSSLDGATQTLPKLYSLPRADFHDITVGSNGGFNATTGYDEVTGLGTPVGNLLVPDLADVAGPTPGPPNDNVAGAVHLTGEVATAQGTNVGATSEPGEQLNTFNSAGQTIWYSWLAPPHAGQVTVSTSGSTFDTTLGVYTGSSVSSLSMITANDDDPTQSGVNTSLVTFQATPGTIYLISVDGSTSSSATTGTVHLSVSAAPDNDNFFSATTLNGTTASDTGFNINATAEPGEPDSAGVAGTQSVWWSWTAPSGVTSATINTHGSDFANTLGVYTGSSAGSLTLIADAQSDAINTSTVTFQIVPFTTYAIMVNGVANPSTGATAQGHVDLSLSTTAPQIATVVGRSLFYYDSAFDGNDAAVSPADDTAIAPDKQPLLPGNFASFANYSSYSRGINGIMIDVSGLPSGAQVTANDFTFRVGNSWDPSTWAGAPAPSAVVDRPGAGAFGADRIEITWSNNAIQNTWLQITMKADANTGLLADDVFYFGNAIGESGNLAGDTIVDSTDELGARNDPHSFLNPADLTNVHDYNRDGRVDAADQLIARNNFNDASTALVLWEAPSSFASPATARPAPAAPHAHPRATDPWEVLKQRLVARSRQHKRAGR